MMDYQEIAKNSVQCLDEKKRELLVAYRVTTETLKEMALLEVIDPEATAQLESVLSTYEAAARLFGATDEDFADQRREAGIWVARRLAHHYNKEHGAA